MKVLILSCNTGGGHNAAASALKESLNFYHHEAEVLDLMSLGRKHTSALVGGAYVKLVSVFPAGFGALYQLGELVRKFPWKSPVYYANARLGNALADYIDQNHFNAVVTTHLYPAETLTWMKQKGRLTIPCVAVATDYACIPFWEETNCDYYVVPHKDLIPSLHPAASRKKNCFLSVSRCGPHLRALHPKRMCAAISVFPRMLRCFSS